MKQAEKKKEELLFKEKYLPHSNHSILFGVGYLSKVVFPKRKNPVPVHIEDNDMQI